MATRERAMEVNRVDVRVAVLSLAAEVRLADITLAVIAERSGISVRTLLRYYGTRDDLIRTVADEARDLVIEERQVYPDDIDRSLELLGDHYEAMAPLVLMMLAQEDTDQIAQAVTSQGRAFHRRWVAELFRLDPGDDEQLDLLVVATDVFTWKLLRIDRALSRQETLNRMRQLVRAVQSHATSTQGR
jgi:AcrR family transcriptional regulator